LNTGQNQAGNLECDHRRQKVSKRRTVTGHKDLASEIDQIWHHHDDFFGTFAPFLRASERPMAMACFLLFTTPPLPPFPDRSVPCFLRRIALLTVLPAALPYLAIIASLLSDPSAFAR